MYSDCLVYALDVVWAVNACYELRQDYTVIWLAYVSDAYESAGAFAERKK